MALGGLSHERIWVTDEFVSSMPFFYRKIFFFHEKNILYINEAILYHHSTWVLLKTEKFL